MSTINITNTNIMSIITPIVNRVHTITTTIITMTRATNCC